MTLKDLGKSYCQDKKTWCSKSPTPWYLGPIPWTPHGIYLYLYINRSIYSPIPLRMLRYWWYLYRDLRPFVARHIPDPGLRSCHWLARATPVSRDSHATPANSNLREGYSLAKSALGAAFNSSVWVVEPFYSGMTDLIEKPCCTLGWTTLRPKPLSDGMNAHRWESWWQLKLLNIPFGY